MATEEAQLHQAKQDEAPTALGQRLHEDIDGQLKSMAVLKEALAGAEGRIENLEQENRCLRGEVDNCDRRSGSC